MGSRTELGRHGGSALCWTILLLAFICVLMASLLTAFQTGCAITLSAINETAGGDK